MDWSVAKGSLSRHRGPIFRRANVVGCGIGYKRVRGQPTLQPAVCVFVREKVARHRLRSADLIPPHLDGVTTDVIETGDLQLLGVGSGWTLKSKEIDIRQEADRTERRRPAQPGVSVANYLVTAGTFGALVIDNQSGRFMILSNNHVLANSTDGRDGRASLGDPILQPGPYDGGTLPRDLIAHLERFVPLNADGDRVENAVDAAVGTVLSPEVVIPELLGLGPVQGVAVPRMGTPIKISGRTSGVRSGSIMALEVTADVGLGTGATARFVNQIATTPIAQPGDSGSLVVDSQLRALGLLFAGSSFLSLANPIQPVLELLDISLVES